MTNYERLLWVLADEFETSISSCFKRAGQSYAWVNSDAEAESLMRRFRGIFLASIIGEIEEKIGRGFTSVVDQLPDTPTVENSKYWHIDMPLNTSTPRGRAKVIWAIRIAYTHGNGHIDQVDDPNVASYLRPNFARKHFRGVEIKK